MHDLQLKQPFASTVTLAIVSRRCDTVRTASSHYAYTVQDDRVTLFHKFFVNKEAHPTILLQKGNTEIEQARRQRQRGSSGCMHKHCTPVAMDRISLRKSLHCDHSSPTGLVQSCHYHDSEAGGGLESCLLLLVGYSVLSNSSPRQAARQWPLSRFGAE